MAAFLAIIIIAAAVLEYGTAAGIRMGKLFPLFNIVRFPNEPCGSKPGETTILQGICYTMQQCIDKGGSSAGNCANGFGVCCHFQLGCGAKNAENCTIFAGSSSSQPQATFCTATVCRFKPNVCQMRLDFIDFSLAGPSEDVLANDFIANGQILSSGLAGVPVTPSTRCLVDYLQLPSGMQICGQNSGEHVYVELDRNECIDFPLFVGRSSDSRKWSIKFSQYSCDFNNLAPQGCTQYFFGSNNGIVRSFNFDGKLHLANQNQNICVRREVNTCEICWSTVESSLDFQLSGSGMMAITDSRLCCAYGNSGTDTRGFDCLLIPGARNEKSGRLLANQFCGASLGLASRGSRTADVMSALPGSLPNKTICSKLAPFSIRFISDNYEFVKESSNAPNGFQLAYILKNC